VTVEAIPELETLDLSAVTLREVNRRLHDAESGGAKPSQRELVSANSELREKREPVGGGHGVGN